MPRSPRHVPSLLPALLAALALPAGLRAQEAKQEAKTVPPGTPVTITVTQAAPSAPPVTITLGPRRALVTPVRAGCTHTGGGNIDVAQPGPDTVVVTLTGVAVAYCGPRLAHAALDFCLTQELVIVFDNPKVKKAKLTLEGRLIGLLRSHCKGGTAEVTKACATLSCGGPELLTIAMPDHAVAGGENYSVNDHEGPCSMPVAAGKLLLHQTLNVAATAPKCLLPHKAPSAEFAPDPALDPLWISAWEPFHGAAKKDFGFQVIIKVAEDTAEEPKTNGEQKDKANGDQKGKTTPSPGPQQGKGTGTPPASQPEKGKGHNTEKK